MLCLLISFDPVFRIESDQYLVDALAGPSGGDGDDGSRTLSAQHDGANGEPHVSSPWSRKRRASSTGDNER